MANMEQIKNWKDTVYPALVSKCEEFHLLGYEMVTTDDIWNCLLAKLERQKADLKLYQIVHEIFRLSVNEYMNWLTIRAYDDTDFTNETDFLFGLK